MSPVKSPVPRLPTLSRSPLRSQVRHVMIDGILNGGFSPGERLNETSIAEALGISQTPVREALLRLEGEGLLEARPAKGFFVRQFSASEVQDLYPLLAHLEVFALELSGELDAGELTELRGINSEFRQIENDAERAARWDDRFHRRLWSRCPNGLLKEQIGPLRQATYRYELAYMREVGHILSSSDQHDEILTALEEGRFDRAGEHLKANLMTSVEPLVNWLLGSSSSAKRNASLG